MQHLIKHGEAIADDSWHVVEAEAIQDGADYPVVPLAALEDFLAKCPSVGKPFGIAFQDDDDPAAAGEALNSAALLVFNMGKFMDGRAFSQIRSVRLRHNYRGEIRVTGDFIPDQVAYLTRCGADSFVCRNEEERSAALEVAKIVSAQYQSDALEPQPRFRRRA